MPISGYDICGDSILGRRWKCSGAEVPTFVYICPVMMFPKCFFSRLRALWREVWFSNIVVVSVDGHDGGQLSGAMWGSSVW